MIFLSIYKTVLQYRTLTVYFLVKVSKYQSIKVYQIFLG